MSEITRTVELLRENWEEDPPDQDRKEPVPQPTIVEEGEIESRSFDYSQSDVIFVRDGGFPVVEPASVGFRDQRLESLLDIDIRTARGRKRLEGEDIRGEYEGLAGEVERIFRKFRLGYGGYDVIFLETYDDQIGDYGAQIYVGVWNIRLVSYAEPIDVDTEYPQ